LKSGEGANLRHRFAVSLRPVYTLRVVGSCEIGTHRESQEDGVGCFSDDGIAIVVDGMGGMRSGMVAPPVVIPAVRRAIVDAREALPELVFDETLEAIVRDAMLAANRALFAVSQQVHLRGVGATVVVAWRHGDRTVIGHLGDARAYRIRDGVIERMTRDHSLAEEFGDTPEYARYIEENPSFQTIITRALGMAETCDPVVRAHPTRDDDVWLLASDGLWRTVPDDDLARLASARSLDEAVLDLIAESYTHDPNDNLSVVLMKGAHEPDAERPLARSAPLPSFESSPPPPRDRALGLLDGETDARSAWETFAARGMIPDDWVEHPTRRFFGPWTKHPKGLPGSADCLREHRAPSRVIHPYNASLHWGPVSEARVLTHPATVREAALFAAAREVILRAEVVAEEVARRLQVRGHATSARPLWTVHRVSGTLSAPLELLNAPEWWSVRTLGAYSDGLPPSGSRAVLQAFYEEARARWSEAEGPDDHPYHDLDAPFDPLLELLALGCVFHCAHPFGWWLSLEEPES
jgi:protein phosphatase